MAGKRQKHPDDLVFKRGGRAQPLTVFVPNEVVDDEGPTASVPAIPPPPDGVNDYALQRWEEFWRSPIAGVADAAAHGEAITHWIKLVSERRDLQEKIKTTDYVVLGSHKQPMTNPYWRIVREMSEQILRYEEAFGMTPLAQLRLGVEFLTGQSLQQSLKGPTTRRPPQMVDRDA